MHDSNHVQEVWTMNRLYVILNKNNCMAENIAESLNLSLQGKVKEMYEVTHPKITNYR